MCTGLALSVNKTNQEDRTSIVFARTMEFGVNIWGNMRYVPKGKKFQSYIYQNPENNETSAEYFEGMNWESKHAYVGPKLQNIEPYKENSERIVEGVNDSGLYVGLFLFPDYANYFTENDTIDRNNIIGELDLADYLLGTFDNVDAIRDKLSSGIVKENGTTDGGTTVVSSYYKPLQQIPPVHFMVQEENGKAIVIEYVKDEQGGCKLNVYDNEWGVITNSPPFDWQKINLGNYANLSANNPEDSKYVIGQGAGMLGLPGDFTPPSRFIRAYALRSTAITPTNTEDGIATAWNLIDNINIVRGNVRELSDAPSVGETCYDKKVDDIVKENELCMYDVTQWTTVYDLKNRKYYFRTNNYPLIRVIDLNELISKYSEQATEFPFYNETTQVVPYENVDSSFQPV